MICVISIPSIQPNARQRRNGGGLRAVAVNPHPFAGVQVIIRRGQAGGDDFKHDRGSLSVGSGVLLIGYCRTFRRYGQVVSVDIFDIYLCWNLLAVSQRPPMMRTSRQLEAKGDGMPNQSGQSYGGVFDSLTAAQLLALVLEARRLRTAIVA